MDGIGFYETLVHLRLHDIGSIVVLFSLISFFFCLIFYCWFVFNNLFSTLKATFVNTDDQHYIP